MARDRPYTNIYGTNNYQQKLLQCYKLLNNYLYTRKGVYKTQGELK